jgi:hypothetical protein
MRLAQIGKPGSVVSRKLGAKTSYSHLGECDDRHCIKGAVGACLPPAVELPVKSGFYEQVIGVKWFLFFLHSVFAFVVACCG